MGLLITGPILDYQLFVDFEITIPTGNLETAIWSPVRGLVDTGAQASHLHPDIVDRLGIPQTGICEINGEPDISIHRTDTRWWNNSENRYNYMMLHMARQLPMTSDVAQALIGMDFIKLFNLQVRMGKSFTMFRE